MRGLPIPGESLRESIRLFSLCSAMEWSVLPIAGGLYDQHPRLLEEWQLIFQEKSAYEEETRPKK